MAKGSAKSDTELQEKLEAIERKVWDAIKSRDVKTAMEAMAEDSWSVDMSGFSSAQQFGQMMQDYTVESYSLQDLKLIRLDKDAAILAYTSTANATYKGEPIPSGPYYCSSIYVNRGGKWLGMFHQETLSQSAMWSEPQNGRTGDIVHPDSTHHHR
ncbi:MAG TPA: nuclear transport factor 2 family protein [Candidatus Eisenbacteria bacterium]